MNIESQHGYILCGDMTGDITASINTLSKIHRVHYSTAIQYSYGWLSRILSIAWLLASVLPS